MNQNDSFRIYPKDRLVQIMNRGFEFEDYAFSIDKADSARRFFDVNSEPYWHDFNTAYPRG